MNIQGDSLAVYIFCIVYTLFLQRVFCVHNATLQFWVGTVPGNLLIESYLFVMIISLNVFLVSKKYDISFLTNN